MTLALFINVLIIIIIIILSPINPGLTKWIKAVLTLQSDRDTADDIFTSATAIVHNVLLQNGNNQPCPSLPKPDYLAQQANRHRQKVRPAEPTDLVFEIDEQFVPEAFYRGSVIAVGDKKHLLFASDSMLHILSKAKCGISMARSSSLSIHSLNYLVFTLLSGKGRTVNRSEDSASCLESERMIIQLNTRK